MPTTSILLQLLGSVTIAMSLCVLLVGEFEIGHHVALVHGWSLQGLGGILIGMGLVFRLGSKASLVLLLLGAILELFGVRANARWMRRAARAMRR